MKNKTILILLGVLLLIQFVSAESFTLTDQQPTIELSFNGKTYTVELVSATDLSATIKVTNTEGKSEIKEISSEGATREINGLSITLTTADETNLRLSARINVDGATVTPPRDPFLPGGDMTIVLTSDSPKLEQLVGGNSYSFELLSATDLSATIKVTDKNGKSESKEINEGSSKEILDVKVELLASDETNLRLSAILKATPAEKRILITDGNSISLTSDNPKTEVSVSGESYYIELVSASDLSATIKVSQTKEISEGSSKKMLGLNIRIGNADETNLKLSADIIMDEKEDDGERFSFKSSDLVKEKVAVNGKIYEVEFVSASDLFATIKVSDSSGESETKEIGEGNPAVQINGIMISVSQADETNLALSVTISVENGRKVLSLTNDNPQKEFVVRGENYNIELMSASDESATIKISQTKEITEGSSKKVGGLDITVNSADETNLKLSASISIGEFEEEEKEPIKEVTPTEETGPVEIPKPEEKEEITEEEKKDICNGCVLEDKCYPFGYRKSGEFCSENKEFTSQLDSGVKCENNFECSSNVCVSGECVSEGFIKKIINWFKRLFGF